MALTTPTACHSFVSDLLYAILQGKATENVIFSPFSIKSCLALAYLGAETTTANEIQTIVQLVGSNKEEIAQMFNQMIDETMNSESAKSKTSDRFFEGGRIELEGAQLKIANRVYIGEKYSLVPKFNELASKYFDSGAENIKFSDSKAAANKINSWIEEKTNNKINNFIDPADLTADTVAILINAIYFKAYWVSIFEKYSTQKHDFFVSPTRKVQVDMMHQSDNFLYADLNDLNAFAVELPYADTDLAMLFILPKEIDGLANVEAKLKDIDIAKISEKLVVRKVRLSIPKFKIEFDITLNDILKKLGLNSMFSTAADFSGLLVDGRNFKLDEVKHKAFIEIDEEGTVAAGTTGGKMILESYSGPPPEFIADHPFFFVIKDNRNVFFAGHVAQF